MTVMISADPLPLVPSADPASPQGYSAMLGIQRTPTHTLARAFTLW
jgi:hypothetical protein